MLDCGGASRRPVVGPAPYDLRPGSLVLFAGLVVFDNLTDYQTNLTMPRVAIRRSHFAESIGPDECEDTHNGRSNSGQTLRAAALRTAARYLEGVVDESGYR